MIVDFETGESLHIFVIRLGTAIEVNAPGGTKTKTSHFWVVAHNLVESVDKVKNKYPDAIIKGADQSDYLGANCVII